MKKAISLIIALCLIFCSVVPSFAATDVTNAAWSTWFQTINSNVSTMKTYLQDFTQSWTTFFETMTGGTPSTLLTFQDLVRDVLRIGDWLAPIADYADGLRPSGVVSIWNTLENTFTSIVAGFNTSNGYLNNLKQALTNYDYRYYNREITTQEASIYAHRDLFGITSDYPRTPWYTTPYIQNNGSVSNSSRNWFYGTPLGNIAVLLRQGMINDSNIYQYRWAADLTHYNDNLTTWDSQGTTLTQVAFTPESAIQGLYRYLAFTQRDVARLTYVFASDQEITAREKAQANQTAVLNNFIDPNGSGSVSVSDLNQMRNTSSDAKNNLDGGVGVSLIWNSFNSNIYTGNDGWFTVTTANNLGYYPQTRELSKSLNDDNLDYPTPMLDAYYNEIYKLFGNEK